MSDDLVKHVRAQMAKMEEHIKSIGGEVTEQGFMPLLCARIEELIAERDQAWKRAAHAEKMWGELEVKLSETTYALKRIASNEFAGVMLTSMPPQDAAAHFARLTLAKLTGGQG